MYKILSLQQFSVYENGGGSRILRRLFEGHEKEVISFCINQSPNDIIGLIKEEKIPAYPVHKKWMRSYLRTFTTWLRYKVFYFIPLRSLIREIKKVEFEVIHIVDQWNFSPQFMRKLIENSTVKKSIWVSFHDHFASTGGYEATTKILWNLATRRLVISNEMGMEYQRLFGYLDYEIITDGVFKNEISNPKNIDRNKTVNVYFAGLLHNDYRPLFKSLTEALNILQKQGYQFKLILRGAQKIPELDNALFPVEFRPMTLNDSVLKSELEYSDILYLPIKFTSPEFYLYSMSTKMIGYLGASATILYHGPKESAANHVLEMKNCAISCFSLCESEMVNALSNALDHGVDYSRRAKGLASEQFAFDKIHIAFWQTKI